jgi:aminoglycoside phosphotransferase (APT) family kinase protein
MHVILQAGGRGSRLRHHTWNKPKCLVSVQGKPVLYHLFDRFPHARFLIIGDYAFDVLKAYLEYNPPPVDYAMVRASAKGTVSGIAQALELVPQDEPVLIAWSDLLIGPDVPVWPDSRAPVVGLTDDFTCRWSLRPDGVLAEVPSARDGVAGIFYVGRRADLPAPPEEGEFMPWFVRAVPGFQTRTWKALREIGDFGAIEAMNGGDGFTRFFNKVEIEEETVRKSAVEPAYAELIDREIAWYREVRALGFARIPAVLGERPFVMQRVQGAHPWQMSDLTARERRAVLADAVDALSGLHARGAQPWRDDEAREVYLNKTCSRVESVRALIPMIDRASVTVNGLKCRNPFSERHAGLLAQLYARLAGGRFCPIHGDPTFSNTLVDRNLRTWFIDPRGYFAKPGVYGDPLYDFAKLYYSAAGGYDVFNRRQFKLHVDEDTVEILMESPPFADAVEAIFGGDFGGRLAEIRILHGLIWLSLSGYVRDDVDSVIAAFFFGLYWLERAGQ